MTWVQFPLFEGTWIFGSFVRARYYSNLGLATGYKQVKMTEESQKKIAFVIHNGLAVTVQIHCYAVWVTQCIGDISKVNNV